MWPFKPKDERRRDFFIKKSFQGSFALLYIFLISIFSFIMGWLLYRKLRKILDFFIFMAHGTYSDTWQIFSRPVYNTILISLCVFLVVILAATLMTAYIISRNCRRLTASIREYLHTGAYTIPKGLFGKEFNKIALGFATVAAEIESRRRSVGNASLSLKNDLDRLLAESKPSGYVEEELRRLLDTVAPLSKLPSRNKR